MTVWKVFGRAGSPDGTGGLLASPACPHQLHQGRTTARCVVYPDHQREVDTVRQAVGIEGVPPGNPRGSEERAARQASEVKTQVLRCRAHRGNQRYRPGQEPVDGGLPVNHRPVGLCVERR